MFVLEFSLFMLFMAVSEGFSSLTPAQMVLVEHGLSLKRVFLKLPGLEFMSRALPRPRSLQLICSPLLGISKYRIL